MWAGDLDSPGGVREAAKAARGRARRARTTARGRRPARRVRAAVDRGICGGRADADPSIELALALDVAHDEAGRWLWLAGGRAGAIAALELWDAESWHALAARQVQFARDTGALVHLQSALNFLARAHLLAGELTTAAQLIEEDRLDRGGNREPAGRVHRDDARGLAGPGGPGICADRGHLAGGDRSAVWAGWSTSRPTRARCSTTALVVTAPRATPPGRLRARSARVRAACRARASRGGVPDR